MLYSYKKIPIVQFLYFSFPIYLFYNGIKYIYLFINNEYIIKYQALLWGIFNIICAFFIAALLAGKYMVLNKLNKKLSNGEYKEVEGEVKSLTLGYLDKFENDKFKVNDIDFEIGFFFKPGLQKTAALGGPIQTNNQKVRIIYINYNDDNYILQIVTKTKEKEGVQNANDSISS
ncbi:MAG: hypothetical protein PHF05_05150 [Candidatus Izemoplasmatales bacterium]|nr:hypothetical protein [Candidatus Izemoplasmatales bacterium]